LIVSWNSFHDFSRASSALSPSKQLLAVTNLLDGIDWYDIELRAFVRSTRYSVKEGYNVSIAFLGENSVVVGHSHGNLVIATGDMARNPEMLKFIPSHGHGRKFDRSSIGI